MTKEEIRQAAQDWDGSGMATPAEEGAFIKGTEWMQEKMIEKATEWLKEKYCSFWIEDFKQAMEE